MRSRQLASEADRLDQQPQTTMIQPPMLQPTMIQPTMMQLTMMQLTMVQPTMMQPTPKMLTQLTQMPMHADATRSELQRSPEVVQIQIRRF